MSIIEHFQRLEEISELLEEKFRLMCKVYDSVDVFKGHKAVEFKQKHPIAKIIKDYYEDKRKKEEMEEDRLWQIERYEMLNELLDEDQLKRLLDDDELEELLD